MILFSPAKLNLFFRVLGKRSDQYHEIASLFQAIDLCDTVIIEKAERDALSCSDPELPCDSSNLAWKALDLFRQMFPFPFFVHIHLEKKIPMRAGLGGGSSNAATVLWGLNQLCNGPAAVEQLAVMGARLGSDVPFFFSTGTAYCTGRGEILESVSLPQPLQGWLAKPSFGLSTPLVYKETCVDALPNRNPREALRAGSFFNDLEPAAFRLEPRLIAFKNRLDAMQFDSVTMTGSGTAFFCLGKPPAVDPALIPFCSLNRPISSWYS